MVPSSLLGMPIRGQQCAVEWFVCLKIVSVRATVAKGVRALASGVSKRKTLGHLLKSSCRLPDNF